MKLTCYNRHFPFVAILCLITSSAWGQGQKSIEWAKFDFAPFFILQGPYKNEGTGDIIYKLLQQALPQYKHHNVLTNYKRIARTNIEKTTICTGTFKRKRTLKLYHFSNPVVTLPSHKLHYLKGSRAEELINAAPKSLHNKLSLEALISTNPDIKIGLLKQRRYGADINKIQQAYPQQFKYWAAGNGNINVTEMLRKNRVDFTLEFPSVSYYTNINDKPEQLLKRQALTENHPSLQTFIGCTKSPLGIRVIGQINSIVDELKTTPDFQNAAIKWVPKN